MTSKQFATSAPESAAAPVRIKALAFRSTLDYLRSRGGDEAVVKTLEAISEEARLELSRPLLATKYLPFSWLLDLMRAGADHLGGDRREVFQDMGVHSCEQALTGVYKIFLKVGSPQFILGRASRLFKTYFQGASEMRVVGQRRGFSQLEVDAFAGGHQDYCSRLDGYFYTVLRLSGAKDIEMEHDECAYRHGKVCCWTGSWK